MSFSDPLIIASAPNGARKTKADHPALPIAPDELAAEAAKCAEAGASLLHLHVRDRNGGHSLDAGAYRAATAAVRRAVGQRLIVQITTEAVGVFTPAQQMACVRAVRPEAASIAVREMIPDAAHEPEAAEFLAWAAAERIMVQYICHEPNDLVRLHDLRRRGVVPGDRIATLYVLGRYADRAGGTPEALFPYFAAGGANDDLVWSMCAFGPREAACALACAALGGHARVGFENNTALADGGIAPDNAALIAQTAANARVIGRDIADADAARRIFGRR
jgi:uncharacterized protein (DUF849 family)